MNDQQSQKELLVSQLKESYASLDASLTQLRNGMRELSLMIEKIESEVSTPISTEAPCVPPVPDEDESEETPVTDLPPAERAWSQIDDMPGLEDFTAVNPADATAETPVVTPHEEPVLADSSEAAPAPQTASSVSSETEEPVADAGRPLTISVVGKLSLAESFFYANELFAGNQGTLREVLEEIERLSSRSQLYSYLYDTLRFSKEEESVRDFVAFVEDNIRER